MSPQEAAHLKAGDLVWTAWSTWGKQPARLVADGYFNGKVTVVKFRVNGRSWTRRLRVPIGEVLGYREPWPAMIPEERGTA